MDNIQVVKQFILKLFEEVKNGNSMENKPITIGWLSPVGVVHLSNVSGLAIKERTKITVSRSYLRHLYNEHYGVNEKDKGQNVPLTDEDVVAFIDVINNPDNIVFMGYNSKEQAYGFSFLKGNKNGTYSLLEVYGNSRGTLKPKTFYNSKRSISGQVMNLLKKPQPYTPETRTHSFDTSKPAKLMIVNYRVSENKGNSFHPKKQEKAKKNIVKATPSKALQQIIDNTPTTTKKQIDMKKTLTLALLLAAAVCGAQTHFPKNFNIDLGGGVNDAGCYTPVGAVGYTFNNWFALYGRYSFATDKVEDGLLTYWEHTVEIYPSFTILSYMDKWFVSLYVGAAYKYQDLLGIPTASRNVTGHNFGAVAGVEGEWHFARYLSAFAGVSYRGLFFKEEPRYEPFASVGVRTSMRVFKKAGRRR
jgi:hypothetical protein